VAASVVGVVAHRGASVATVTARPASSAIRSVSSAEAAGTGLAAVLPGRWQVADLRRRPAGAPSYRGVVAFDSNGAVSLDDGCNGVVGVYRVRGDGLLTTATVGAYASCRGVGDLAALLKDVRVTITGRDQLDLVGTGVRLLRVDDRPSSVAAVTPH
jgi:hypothetical protein